jgi:hypothetical protein
MNLRLFSTIGTCDSCREKKCELHQVKINNEIKEFCEECLYGYKLTLEEELEKENEKKNKKI